MTTAERRIAAVESQLTSTERVVAWLEEAHAYGSIDTYFDAQLAQEPVIMPLDRLVHDTVEAARAQNPGLPRLQAAAAQDRAVIATVFRFQLALGVITATHAALDREVYLQIIVASQLAMSASDPRPNVGEPQRADSLTRSRGLALAQVTELMTLEAARIELEAKYLAGHTALFPGLRLAWDTQLQEAQTLAAGAMRLGELDGLAAVGPVLLEPTPERIAERMRRIVAPAKVKTFDAVGDGSRTLEAIVGWMRPSRDDR